MIFSTHSLKVAT